MHILSSIFIVVVWFYSWLLWVLTFFCWVRYLSYANLIIIIIGYSWLFFLFAWWWYRLYLLLLYEIACNSISHLLIVIPCTLTISTEYINQCWCLFFNKIILIIIITFHFHWIEFLFNFPNNNTIIWELFLFKIFISFSKFCTIFFTIKFS